MKNTETKLWEIYADGLTMHNKSEFKRDGKVHESLNRPYFVKVKSDRITEFKKALRDDPSIPKMLENPNLIHIVRNIPLEFGGDFFIEYGPHFETGVYGPNLNPFVEQIVVDEDEMFDLFFQSIDVKDLPSVFVMDYLKKTIPYKELLSDFSETAQDRILSHFIDMLITKDQKGEL